MAFWYNTSTGQVETDENRGRALDVLGPFTTREEAQRAVDNAHQRARDQDDEDETWSGTEG